MKATTYALTLSFVAAMIATAPVSAAPVLTNTAAVKAAVPDLVTEVYWRGGRGYGGWGYRGWGYRGVVGGLALGAALAAPAYGYGCCGCYRYGCGYSSYDTSYPYYDTAYPSYGSGVYLGGYPGTWRRGYYARRAYWDGYSGYGVRRAYYGGYLGYGVRRAYYGGYRGYGTGVRRAYVGSYRGAHMGRIRR